MAYPTVIDIPKPAVGSSCTYELQGPSGSDTYVKLTGTVTAVRASAFAFKGTAVDLVIAALAPEPSGLHDVDYTCSFPARKA